MTMGQLFLLWFSAVVCSLSFRWFDKEFQNSDISHTRIAEQICHCSKAQTEVYKTISVQFRGVLQEGLIKLGAGQHLQSMFGTLPN